MINESIRFIKIWNNQWKAPDKLRALQTKLLRTTIKHAYETVPYYNSLFKRHGLKPSNIRELEDINKIPILTKDLVKKAGTNILSTKYLHRKLLVNNTAGSTGKPLTTYRTMSTRYLGRANRFRIFFTNGFKIYDSITRLKYYPPPKKFFHYLGINRCNHISYELDIPQQANVLQSLHPSVIDGRPGRLEQICRHLRDKGIKIIRPNLIFSDSECLFDYQRELIRNWLGVNPIDIYGSVEFGDVAWECHKHEGYHINSDLLHLQIIDPQNPSKEVKEGERGFIVISNFSNPAMPFLRYSIEDTAVPTNHHCSCGRSFPLLKEISGRVSGFLTLPSGNQIPGATTLSTVLRNYNEIEQYRAIQKNDGHLQLEIKIEPDKTIPEQEIINNLKNICGDLKIQINIVNEIPKNPAGKFVPFMSEIKLSS